MAFGKNSRWADEARRDVVVERWEAGDSVSQIAKHLGCTKNSVSGIIKRHLIPAGLISNRASPVNRTSWSDEGIAELRELCAIRPPLTMPEIARRMGISPNAADNKARREGFITGPSPVTRGRPCGSVRHPKAQRDWRAEIVAHMPEPELPIEPPLPLPGVGESRYPVTESNQCCWPIGDPGTRGFRFCEAVRVGRSYCAKHEAIAYRAVPLRDNRADVEHTPSGWRP